MPDFDEVYEHARQLADLTAPRERAPGLATWAIAVAQHWEALAVMWRDPDGTPMPFTPPPEPMTIYTPDRRAGDPGGALERPYQIDIDARHSVIHQPEAKTRHAMCGQCGTRYEISDDPVENHHRAMRHKVTCGKANVDQYSEPQRAALLEDFHSQPMQVSFRERAAAALAAGTDPEVLKLTGVSIFGDDNPRAAALRELGAAAAESIRKMAPPAPPRRWWKFWRWFE